MKWKIYLTALLCAPVLAQAQAYKCKQPDGSSSFQDKPCAAGAGSKITITPAMPEAAPGSRPAPKSVAVRGAEPKPNPAEEARAKAVEEQNRMARCQRARQQLGVAQTARPVYSTDKSGNRTYVDDADRAALLGSSEQRVRQECG